MTNYKTIDLEKGTHITRPVTPSSTSMTGNNKDLFKKLSTLKFIPQTHIDTSGSENNPTILRQRARALNKYGLHRNLAKTSTQAATFLGAYLGKARTTLATGGAAVIANAIDRHKNAASRDYMNEDRIISTKKRISERTDRQNSILAEAETLHNQARNKRHNARQAAAVMDTMLVASAAAHAAKSPMLAVPGLLVAAGCACMNNRENAAASNAEIEMVDKLHEAEKHSSIPRRSKHQRSLSTGRSF